MIPAALSETNLISDRDLVLRFESLGDNCEFGFVQRMLGVEPPGLLRFSGAPIQAVVSALKARFEGIDDPGYIRIHAENGEYMVSLAKYEFYCHAEIKVGEMTPEAVHQQQCQTVGLLARKLIADLERPTRILVFRQNEPVLAGDLIDLRLALSALGPGILLWVREACPGHPPGTLDMADERLMVGYVRRLAPRDDVPNLDLESWLAVLRRAYEQSLQPRPGAFPRLARTELNFGLDGNAARSLGYGWSGPEPGYQWSVDDKSLLTLASPGHADEYWLEMEVKPFVSPPSVPHQRLDVRIGETLVKRFDSLPRGRVGCVVPGHLVAGAANVDIVLEHPDAASPALVTGGRDDRRLAICFQRLALVCCPQAGGPRHAG
jgi:hypothetical protein